MQAGQSGAPAARIRAAVGGWAALGEVWPAGHAGQDRAALFARSDGFVGAIADGAGASGGRAADEVIAAIERAALDPHFDAAGSRNWCALLETVDRALAVRGDSESTAVVAFISSAGIAGASVGDSVAWLVHPGRHDDLTARQARRPFIGSGDARPEPFSHPASEGTLVLASDGVWKYANAERLRGAYILSSLESALEAVSSLIRLPSGDLQDDASAVLCRKSDGR